MSAFVRDLPRSLIPRVVFPRAVGNVKIDETLARGGVSMGKIYARRVVEGFPNGAAHEIRIIRAEQAFEDLSVLVNLSFTIFDELPTPLVHCHPTQSWVPILVARLPPTTVAVSG